jgi:hypothetical protein
LGGDGANEREESKVRAYAEGAPRGKIINEKN